MFNPADPHHQKAVEIINQQGRRKSQFITAAILHYVDCNRIPASTLLQDQQLDSLIEQIIKKTLAVQGYQKPPTIQPQSKAPQQTPQPAMQVDDFYEGEIPLTDADEELLLRGLDSFK